MCIFKDGQFCKELNINRDKRLHEENFAYDKCP